MIPLTIFLKAYWDNNNAIPTVGLSLHCKDDMLLKTAHSEHSNAMFMESFLISRSQSNTFDTCIYIAAS